MALSACGSTSGDDRGNDDTVDDTFCIAEGTLVDTPSGPVPIERLRVGDQVWSVDPTTHERFAATVTRIVAAQRECMALQFAGGELVCTPSHPLLDPSDGTYAPAGEWVVGPQRTQLLVAGDGAVAVQAVEGTKVDVGVRRVFDISVDHPLHNFVAGSVVVHNKSIDPCWDDSGSDPYCTPASSGPTTVSTSGPDTATEGPDPSGIPPGDATSDPTDVTTDATTDPGDGTATTTTDGTSTGSDTGFGSGDTSAACTPITEDGSAVGSNCAGGQMCPDGYTCQPFNGVIVQEQCQILCEDECECPADHTCNLFIDKVATWMACVPS